MGHPVDRPALLTVEAHDNRELRARWHNRVEIRPLPDSKLILPAREGYDRWAPFYDHGRNPSVGLKDRQVRRLLGEVRGLRVADLGCGTGRNAIALAEAGARVTAVDFSSEMLSQARQKPGAGRVRFIVHDLKNPLPLDSDSYDRVLCSLALEHVQDLDVAFGEMARICRPEGRVVIIEMHPALLLQGISARFHDPKTGQDIRPRSVGHRISDFVMAAVRAGLAVEEMQEFFDQDGNAAWPLLLTMKFRPS